MPPVLEALINLLFPPQCLVCGALAEPFCEACRRLIDPVEDSGAPFGLDAIRSVGHHEGPLRRAVLRLKFERKIALAAPLAGLIAAEIPPEWRLDGVTAVPLHWTRRLERGFNQSELLVEEVARVAGIAALPALHRIRATGHQVGRRPEDRREGVRGAFRSDSRVAGKRILLLDDVWTTGATLSECAASLRAAGAAAVFAATVTHEPLRLGR